MANNSSQLIVGVRCSLQQILTVSARGRSHRMISELASVVMPGVHRGGSVGIKGTPLATAPLWLPKFSPTTGALFSRVTPTIIVSHRVVVQTKTKSDYVQDPFIKLPVTLYTLNPPPAATLVAAPVDGEGLGPAAAPVAMPVAYAPRAGRALPRQSIGLAQGVALDTTGDGYADSWGWDTNGDGRLDHVRQAKAALDTTRDGYADSWGYDTTGDGRADVVHPIVSPPR